MRQVECPDSDSEIIGRDYFEQVIPEIAHEVLKGETVHSIVERICDGVPFYFEVEDWIIHKILQTSSDGLTLSKDEKKQVVQNLTADW